VTHAGGPPVDLNLPPNAAMPIDAPGPVFASWSKRVVAAGLDSAIGAGMTFLALGDQSVTVPFIGTSFQPAGGQGVLTTSWTDSGWVISAVLLVIVMQAYLGVTPGKIVIGIAVVHERDARPIGLVRTTVRWLLHVFDSILLIGYLRPSGMRSARRSRTASWGPSFSTRADHDDTSGSTLEVTRWSTRARHALGKRPWDPGGGPQPRRSPRWRVRVACSSPSARHRDLAPSSSLV
jgi:uncharacterized RDD family membrane protein YckC